MDVCCGSSIKRGDKAMKNLYLKVFAVIGVTCLSVWFIPGVDDVVELFFQVIVLIAAS